MDLYGLRRHHFVVERVGRLTGRDEQPVIDLDFLVHLEVRGAREVVDISIVQEIVGAAYVMTIICGCNVRDVVICSGVGESVKVVVVDFSCN